MPRWAKISDVIAEDITVADMLSSMKEARALALFLMSLPRADVYGVLPGEPRPFKARVCPAAHLSEIRIAEVISILQERGLVTSFQNEAGAYLYIRNYHRYQEIRWDRVGSPEIVMPYQWEPPPELIGWLSGQNKQKQAEFCARIPALSRLLLDGPGVSRTLPPSSSVVAVTDAVTDKITPSVGSCTPEPPPPIKVETAKQRKARKAKEEQELLAEFDDCRELIDDYMAHADDKLKTGTTVAGRVTKLEALVDVANEVDSPEAFRYGLRQANAHGAPNPNYVKQAALNWREKHGS